MGEVDIAIRLLGPVEVVRDGKVVDVGGRRPRTLLAILALEPGRVVPADRLIEELWAGEPTGGAATTLKVHVSRLRAALGGAFPIRGSTAGYAVVVAPDAVDVRRFERRIAEARGELAAHPRRAARVARAALELWRGRPFGELADEGALRTAAARLEELHLEALELRLDADLAMGRAAELISELEALVAAHPYRERLWRQLMLALYRADRQADALAAYHRARTALDEQLGIEPGHALQDLEAAILRQDVEAPATGGFGGALPHHVSSFLGRGRELGEVRTLVREHRLVTLVGTGGVGKTRLAIEAARAALDDDLGEPAFIDLALVSEPADVPGHVARALNVAESPGRSPQSAIVEQVGQTSILIVLDNCEHVREAAGELVGRVLTACPGVRVLATSREVLGLAGEQTYVVGPLGVGGVGSREVETTGRELPDAVELFIARLREARPGFVVDEAAIAQAREVCLTLDGLPLAIELAASRGRVLSLPEISQRIADRFRFLVSWRRVTTARHRTLREAMDWSYDLLASDEQAFLRSAAVFVGGFTVEAASTVCTEGDEDAALRLVTRLVEASLLSVTSGATGTRYSMLETVRQFAIDRSNDDEQALVAQRHVRFFLDVAEAHQAAVPSGGNLAPLHDLFEDEANLRAALRRTEEASAMPAQTEDDHLTLRFAAALWRYWWLNGLLADGREFIDRALARTGGSDVARLEALRGASSLALRQGDVGVAVARARAAVELAETQGELAIARATVPLANALGSQGETREAAAMYQAAADTFRRLGQPWDLANALLNTADVAFLVGDLDLVERAAGESLAESRRTGDDAGMAVNLANLAFAALEHDDADRAELLLREALERSTKLGFREWIAIMVEGLGAVAAARGDAGTAARLLGVAGRMRDEIGASLDSIERRVHERTLAQLAERMGQAALDSEMAAGGAMANEEALALARA